MQRFSLLKPPMSMMRKPAAFNPFLPAASLKTPLDPQSRLFSSIVRTKGKETLREREDRRRELSKLMDSW